MEVFKLHSVERGVLHAEMKFLPGQAIHETQITKSRSIVILQTNQKPPHFILQVDGKDKLEISPGRHNLFHTLLFFLHHIKTKEYGMLGRINLGPSGINILWVIEN